jgi:DNA modification methylase
MRETRCDIKRGDCLELLRDYPDNSFDLIFTSLPYADSRAKTYGGIRHDLYVDWFLPRAEQYRRRSTEFILKLFKFHMLFCSF